MKFFRTEQPQNTGSYLRLKPFASKSRLRPCRVVTKKFQKTLIFSLWGNCTVLPFLAYCDRLGGQEQFHKVVSTLIELSNHFHYVTWRDNLLDEALWVILEQKAAQKNIENSRLSAKCLKLWDFFQTLWSEPSRF